MSCFQKTYIKITVWSLIINVYSIWGLCLLSDIQSWNRFKTAQYLLGHSDIRMTSDIYTHIGETKAFESADIINAYFSKGSQKVVKTQKI